MRTTAIALAAPNWRAESKPYTAIGIVDSPGRMRIIVADISPMLRAKAKYGCHQEADA